MRLATEEMLVESVTYPAFNISNVTYYGDQQFGGQLGMVRLLSACNDQTIAGTCCSSQASNIVACSGSCISTEQSQAQVPAAHHLEAFIELTRGGNLTAVACRSRTATTRSRASRRCSERGTTTSPRAGSTRRCR